MRAINEIIVHCTATPEGRAVSVQDIRRWHQQRGWANIGYHYVVHLDGRVEEGRPVAEVGAHAAGRNARTIGVVYVGGLDRAGKPKDTRTPAQKAALRNLLARLVKEFPGITQISGHRDYANKACPCFNARAEYARLLGARPVALLSMPPQEDDGASVADGADELPWWRRSPVLRQITSTFSAAGITASAALGLDYRAIIALGVVVGVVAITALIIQARKPASTEGLA